MFTSSPATLPLSIFSFRQRYKGGNLKPARLLDDSLGSKSLVFKRLISKSHDRNLAQLRGAPEG
jgi:hypothetical protein